MTFLNLANGTIENFQDSFRYDSNFSKFVVK